jgi:hypothetical protein
MNQIIILIETTILDVITTCTVWAGLGQVGSGHVGAGRVAAAAAAEVQQQQQHCSRGSNNSSSAAVAATAVATVDARLRTTTAVINILTYTQSFLLPHPVPNPIVIAIRFNSFIKIAGFLSRLQELTD